MHLLLYISYNIVPQLKGDWTARRCNIFIKAVTKINPPQKSQLFANFQSLLRSKHSLQSCLTVLRWMRLTVRTHTHPSPHLLHCIKPYQSISWIEVSSCTVFADQGRPHEWKWMKMDETGLLWKVDESR